MRNPSYFIKGIIVGLIIPFLHSACGPRWSEAMQTTPGSLPEQIPIQETEITSASTAYSNQITYVSSCDGTLSCMYALDVGCFEEESPCFGEQRVLFKLENGEEEPRPPGLSSSWSPDGKQLAIGAAGRGGNGDIFLWEADAERWTNLTNSLIYEGQPTWSPDGQTIAFSANTGEPEYNVRAFSISPSTRQETMLLNTLGSSFTSIHDLSWSPDGIRIVFTHQDRAGNDQLFIANADGSNLKQLTDQPYDHFRPHFSTDGSWIAFARSLEKYSLVSNIFVISVEGGEQVGLTNEVDGLRSESSWSPDSNWIIFTSEINGNSDVYMIRSNGRGLVRITETEDDEIAVSWRSVLP